MQLMCNKRTQISDWGLDRGYVGAAGIDYKGT